MIWALKRPIEPTRYSSSWLTEAVALKGIVGSARDTCNRAAAEIVIELYKTEATAKESHLMAGQLVTSNDVEGITFGGVNLCNNDRLRSTFGNTPTEERERNRCTRLIGPSTDSVACKTAA